MNKEDRLVLNLSYINYYNSNTGVIENIATYPYCNTGDCYYYPYAIDIERIRKFKIDSGWEFKYLRRI